MEHLWTTNLCGYAIKHCMNKNRIYVTTFGRAVFGHLFILDRSNGQLLHQIFDLHPRGILAVKIFENRILATTDHWGTIKFHSMNGYDFELTYKEDTYPNTKYEPDGKA